jgi:MarR family transcriptional repressor of emrRAB
MSGWPPSGRHDLSFDAKLLFVNFVLSRYHQIMTNTLPELLAALSRAMQNEQRQAAVSAGLLPVQLAILGYLRDANRYSNTQQALTEYLGLTKGTVSQSLKVLEERGWLVRQGDTVDRRSVRLGLSAAGLAMLATVVDDAWSQLLTRLLSAWQHARHGKTFGVCHSCRHFRPGQTSHQCGLTGEALSDEDSARKNTAWGEVASKARHHACRIMANNSIADLDEHRSARRQPVAVRADELPSARCACSRCFARSASRKLRSPSRRPRRPTSTSCVS